LEANKNSFSADDEVKYNNMINEIASLDKQIDRIESLNEVSKSMDVVVDKPILDKFSNPKASLRGSSEYKNAFSNMLRGAHRTTFQNVLQIGTDSLGGFLTAEEFEARLIEGLQEANVMRGLSTVYTTDSNSVIPVSLDDGEVYAVGENQAIPLTDLTFGQVTLGAYKYATNIKVSWELLKDSKIDIISLIAGKFARSFGKKEEQLFITGTGVNEPTGLLTSITPVVVDEIDFDSVIDLYFSLLTPYCEKASWLLSRETLRTLRKLKDSNGQYLWAPALTVGTPESILGNPVYTSPYVPDGTILFGDFKYYNIADRQPKEIQRLDELFALNGQVGFAAFSRFDGKLTLPEAVNAIELAEVEA
jgi:HK97 family phage major capsid protein